MSRDVTFGWLVEDSARTQAEIKHTTILIFKNYKGQNIAVIEISADLSWQSGMVIENIIDSTANGEFEKKFFENYCNHGPNFCGPWYVDSKSHVTMYIADGKIITERMIFLNQKSK